MTSDRHLHLHPVAAVAEAFGGLRDLAVPLVIGVVAGGRGSSLSAIGLGVLGVAAAAVLGIARWRSTRYAVDDRALYFRAGIFSPDETVVPLDRIQSVDTVAGPIQRVFGVTGLQVQTAGGGEDAEVVLSALSAAAARELRAALRHPDTGASSAGRRLRGAGLLATALTAPQVGVVLPVVGGLFGALQNGLAGESVAVVRSVNSVHEVVLVVLGLLACAWALSTLGAIVAFAGFEVHPVEGRLRIRRGLLQRRAVSVPVNRIDGVQIVESLLRRPFGLVTLRLEITSLGGSETAERTLFPLLRRDEVEAFLEDFVPDLAGALALQERPPRRARRRFLTRPLLAAAAAGAALVVALPAAWPAAPVLLAVAAVAGLDAYAAAGVRIDATRVVVRGRHGAARVTLIARRRRVQRLVVSRSPLQRRAGLASFSVTVARGTRLAIRHLERAQAAALLGRLAPPQT
jgi:putative membrane protein